MFCSPQCLQPLWLLLLLSLLDIDILNTVVVLWCLSALTHFDSSPFSPLMSLCCAVVSECMGLHALHMKGWLWLTLLRRRKEGLGGSASRPTLMVNPVVSLLCFLALVYLCVCANGCFVLDAQIDLIEKNVQGLPNFTVCILICFI